MLNTVRQILPQTPTTRPALAALPSADLEDVPAANMSEGGLGSRSELSNLSGGALVGTSSLTEDSVQVAPLRIKFSLYDIIKAIFYLDTHDGQSAGTLGD